MRPPFRIAYFAAILAFTTVAILAMANDPEPHNLHPLVFVLPTMMLADYYLTLTIAALMKQQYPRIDLARFELNPMWKADVVKLRLINPGHILLLIFVFSAFYLLSQAPPGPWAAFYLSLETFLIFAVAEENGRHVIKVIWLMSSASPRTNARMLRRQWWLLAEPAQTISLCCLGLLALCVVAFVAPAVVVAAGAMGLAANPTFRALLIRESRIGRLHDRRTTNDRPTTD